MGKQIFLIMKMDLLRRDAWTIVLVEHARRLFDLGLKGKNEGLRTIWPVRLCMTTETKGDFLNLDTLGHFQMYLTS